MLKMLQLVWWWFVKDQHMEIREGRIAAATSHGLLLANAERGSKPFPVIGPFYSSLYTMAQASFPFRVVCSVVGFRVEPR
jgi:hypothetical protein